MIRAMIWVVKQVIGAAIALLLLALAIDLALLLLNALGG